ncbi:MAG: GNAT family N-acetyltransferase [Bacteroidales bacterium]|nr:GNAT family N-acetyltransferase [Bacteroidales bacterium]MDD3914881.1 GNAT family N-acetyltransferase [Bacteroidales bacterium]MDD4634666.1 GNAT family N-acetyltransferase [Bacteroidales bacterium]
MLSFRKKISPDDASTIRKMLEGTHFFDEAIDEIDVAIELVQDVISNGNNVENYRIIIAEDNSNVVGYICFARVPCTVSTYEIYWLCVEHSEQGKGIGHLLINEALSEITALNGSKIVLQTAGRNQYLSTQLFYKSCGFIEEARLKNYFVKGDDCLIFSMDIK